MSRPTRRLGTLAVVALYLTLPALRTPSSQAAISADLETPRAVYGAACAACHAANGRGEAPSLLGFDVQPPDFTDCDFAAREPDSDWVGVAYEGGPSRGFSEFMPAFQGALTVEQVQLAVDHIRTFCTDKRWPRGELNLPRALITNKAYPEDEAAFTTLIDLESPAAILNKVIYEKRFGPRSQWEIAVPFGWLETEDVIANDGSTRWASSVGDIAIALKHAFYHNYRKGSIVSFAGELILL